jgi:hypothetical protein
VTGCGASACVGLLCDAAQLPRSWAATAWTLLPSCQTVFAVAGRSACPIFLISWRLRRIGYPFLPICQFARGSQAPLRAKAPAILHRVLPSRKQGNRLRTVLIL